MLSKRNYQERLRQMEQKTERFSIRKLTIGAASVLIGLSFLGFNAHTAHAATPEGVTTVKVDTNKDANATSLAANSSAAASTEAKASQAPASQSAAESAATPAASSASEKAASSASSSAASSATSENASSAAKSEDTKAIASSAAKDDNVITSNGNGVITGKNSKGTWAALADEQGQTIAATNWNELANALNSSTVTTIDLKGDITVDNSSNATKGKKQLYFTNSNISREVTINGNDHTINFGDYSLTYYREGNADLIHPHERSKKSPWNVTFNNVTINANNTNPFGFDGNTYGAAKGDDYNNPKYDLVKFNNVTANIKEGSLIDSDNVNVQFSGDNKITLQGIQDKVAGINANSVKVLDGTTTINAASDAKPYLGANGGSGTNVIMLQPHSVSDFDNASDPNSYDALTINKDATLNINADAKDQDGNLINSTIPEQYDLRGIVTDKYSSLGTTAQLFAKGTMTVAGTLNENMGSGVSTAIALGNLNINDTGKVNINTKQDNAHQGHDGSILAATTYAGYHSGVISLNVGGAGSTNIQSTSSSLIDNGSLTIVRKDVPATNQLKGEVNAPLISFGTYGGNDGSTYTLNVGEGATLDLQDYASTANKYQSGKPMTNTPATGLINMWGIGSNDILTFTKPAYVNLQRAGKQTGTLIRLEGQSGKKSGNVIQLNGVTPGGTPLSQWDAGNYTTNPSNTWRIQNLTAHGAKGENGIRGFEAPKGSKQDYSTTFLNSNGTVTLTMDKTGKVVYKRDAAGQIVNPDNATPAQEVELNNFLNDFNLWTAQRMEFGNNATVAQPAYAPTDVKQGTTKTVDPFVYNKPTDAPDQDQMKVTYAPTDDTPTWVTVDQDTGKLTLAPTADNSKVGMYNVPVKVTNTDETDSDRNFTNVVYAPVFVTDGNETVNWTKDPNGDINGAIVITTDPSALKAHETSDNNMDLKATDAVKSIDKYQMDTETTISTTPTSIAKDSKGITISWGTEPSTVVSEATKGETIKGAVNVTFDKDSQPFADQVVVKGDNYKTTSDLNIDAPGAVAQETAPATKVSASVGDKLTDAQFKALVNSFVPASEINHATLQSVDKDNAVVRITFNDKDAKGQNTYLDVKVPASYIDTNSDAALYNPHYNPVNVNKGGKVETGAPIYTGTDGKTTTAPEGTKYEISGNPTYPEGVTATVDPNTGNVTVTTSDNTPEGPVFVPVTVTYPDTTSETVYAPIAVGSNTFIGTDYSVSVDTNLDNLHETTANSMNPDAKDAITKITWWNNNDVRAGKNLDGTVIYDKAKGTGNLDDITAEWTNPINTNVDKATMDEILPGSNTSTVDTAKNPAIKITYGANSQLIKDTGNGLFTTQGGSQIARWYGNGVTVEGAAPVSDAASKKLEVKPAKAGAALTDAEKALLDLTNLKNLTTNKPVSYTWANDLKDGDTKGTVRITFQDKDKNGQPTYLDIELPAGSLNVTDGTGNPTTPTDADKYDANGGNITVDKGHKLTDGDAEDAITNHTKLPEGTKYTWEYAPDTDTVGDKNGIVTVTYPDGSVDEVPTIVHVTDNNNGGNTNTGEPTTTNPTDADVYNPIGQDIPTKEGQVPDPSQGISNKDQLPGGTTYTWQDPGKVADDVKHPGSHPEIIVVHYPDGSIDTVTVNVNVPTPEPKPIDTPQGVVPDPSKGIKNPDDMPDGTKYQWTNGTPDVSTPGTHEVSITVIYPDGTTDTITTTITVAPHATNNNNHGKTRNINEGAGVHSGDWYDENGRVHASGLYDEYGNGIHSSFYGSGNGNGNAGQKTLPQTGAQANMTGVLGLMIASVGAILGLAADKKRKN